MSCAFYIINDDFLCERNDKQRYSISSTSFVTTKDNDTIYFQMLKDTFFNNILTNNQSFEYQIIKIDSTGSNEKNKQLILDFFNCNTRSNPQNIKSLMTFNSNTNNININNSRFSINSGNINLELFINDYKGKFYISNPSFSISANYLNNLIGN